MKKISLIVMSCMIACGLLANHGIVKGGEMSPKVEDTVSIAKKITDSQWLSNNSDTYNPQNEMFSHLGTKRYNFKNETQLFKVIPHTSKFQKNRPASPERNTFEGS